MHSLGSWSTRYCSGFPEVPGIPLSPPETVPPSQPVHPSLVQIKMANFRHFLITRLWTSLVELKHLEAQLEEEPLSLVLVCFFFHLHVAVDVGCLGEKQNELSP